MTYVEVAPSVGEPWDTIATILNWTIWLAFVAEFFVTLRFVLGAQATDPERTN